MRLHTVNLFQRIVDRNFLRGSETLLGIGLLLLAIGLFFNSFIFSEQFLFYSDFGFVTYPIKFFLSQAYHAGSLPFWNPYLYSGTPFMAAFHPGVFYPPSVLFFLNDVSLAINWFYLFHVMILGLPVYGLVKSWGLSWTAALASALTACLSCFFISSTMLSNFFLAAVWLPLIFLLFQAFILEKRIGWLAGAVLALACQTLAACPEVSILTGLLLAAYTLLLVPYYEGSLHKPGRVAALGLLLVMALGLSALQLVPTYQLTHWSVREGGMPFADHAYRSMAASQLAQLLLPFDFDKYLNGTSGIFRINTFYINIYMGLFAVVFLGFSFLNRKNPAVLFWLLVFFAGIFLALGSHNPVYRWIYSVTPFLDLFRFPEKYFFLSAFALIFLTGHMFDYLVRAVANREIGIKSIVTFLILIFSILGIAAVVQPNYRPEIPILLLMVFGLGYTLFYFKRLKEVWFRAGVLLLIAVDLTASGSQVMPLMPRSFYEQPPQLLERIKHNKEPVRLYTGKTENPLYKGFPNEPGIRAGYLAAKEHFYPYWGMIHEVGYVNGIPGLGLELKDHRLWEKIFHSSSRERRLRILQRSNVTHWIDGDRPTEFAQGRPVIRPERLQALPGALPRAYLVPQVRRGREPQLLNTYYDESFDPLKEVLLSQPVEFEPTDHFEGKVEEVSYRPNQVTVKTSQEGNGFLVLMDSYFPGWTVTIDGQEGSILQANHFYRAVQLGPGRHTLVFDYFPEGFKDGLTISGVTLVAGLAGAVLWGRFSTRSI